ncbi:MAG TPA: energy transducer TonB [Methylomirabilota bacterium]|jgi:protein TonB
MFSRATQEAHAFTMMYRLTFKRLMPAAASLLLHAGLAAAIVLGPGEETVRTPVILAELIEPEAQPVPPPIVADRRPVRPPKPIETPLPAALPPTPTRAEPEPAAPRRPEAEPAPSAVAPPVAARAPEPPAPAVPAPPVTAPPARVAAGPAATGGRNQDAGAFAVPVPPTPEAPAGAPAAGGPSAAAIPRDGVTQRANPRGGYQHRPAYPSSARRLGIQGTTLLSVLVGDDGRVAEVVVKQSAGHPDLDHAAADAVRRWRFEPARRGTEAVVMWVLLPVEFRLR